MLRAREVSIATIRGPLRLRMLAFNAGPLLDGELIRPSAKDLHAGRRLWLNRDIDVPIRDAFDADVDRRIYQTLSDHYQIAIVLMLRCRQRTDGISLHLYPCLLE